MWKPRPDEKPFSSNSQTFPTTGVTASGSGKEKQLPDPVRALEPFRADIAAHIGKSVLVKGELSGSEDLYLDGQVDGAIELQNHSLVVGPNGRVRANIRAREVVLHGKVEGNIFGAERVELKSSSFLTGDITTQRIVIEEGASFKGTIDPQPTKKAEPIKAVAAVAAGAAPAAGHRVLQESLLEHA
jgi:cytoskeletal protein CcmA (bactofilin family)